MRLTAQLRYPDADPDTVFGMLTDRVFAERTCAATGSLAYEVEATVHPDGAAQVVSTRTLPTDEVPEFVRRLVGGTVRVTERTRWQPAGPDGVRHGAVTVELPGAPVGLTGTLRLAPDGADTVYELDGELKAAVPLIGGRVEKAAEPAIRGALRVQERTGRDWLAEHR